MWTSISELAHPFLQKNSRALKKNQPDLVTPLISHRDRTDILVQGDLTKWYACKYITSSGEFFVHGKEPLEREIVQFATPVQQAFHEGAWLVVLIGSGMGIVLPSIAAYLDKHHRGEPKGVLCLEQDPGLFCAGMCLYDYQALLQSGRILFALGPNLFESLLSVQEQHHLETLDPSQIRIFVSYRIEDTNRTADYEHAIQGFRKSHQESRNHYFDLLRTVQRQWSPPSSEIKKVWTHVNDDRGDGGILLGLADGFREIGLDSRYLFFKDRLFTRFYRCAHDFFSFQPDLILSINHSSDYVASFARDIPIRRLIWYVDHPRNTVEIPYNPNDYAVAFSPSFLEEIEQRGGRALGIVPAASRENFEKPPFQPHWKHDVAYVGSVIDFLTVFQQMNKQSRSWVESVLEEQLKNPLKPLSEILSNNPFPNESKTQLAEVLAQQIPKARFMNSDQLIAYFLYAEANTRRRLRFMMALKSFNRIGIYGPADWERLLPDDLRSCYLGPIETNEELGEFYRSCKVNLSINSLQGFDFINPRIFEVPALGGFLVAEWAPELETFFEQEKELFWFKTLEEMQELIELALSDEGLRLATISRAQERIRQDHLYRYRAQTILELLNA